MIDLTSLISGRAISVVAHKVSHVVENEGDTCSVFMDTGDMYHVEQRFKYVVQLIKEVL